jgi:hypothetical protein
MTPQRRGEMGVGMPAKAQRVAAEHAEQDAKTQRDRAQHSLALATATANGLVFNLAEKFRDVVGVPASTIRDILDRARKLQADGEDL